jgi:hypothetical protein
MTTITQKIKTTAADLAKAKAVEQQIEQAIAALPRTGSDTGADAQTLRIARETAAADLALASVGAGDLEQAKANLQAAESAQLQADEIARGQAATLAGLQRKLDLASVEVQQLTKVHKAAQADYILERMKEADAKYVNLAASITQEMARIKACRSLLIDYGHAAMPGNGELVDFLAMGPISAGIACDRYNAQGGGFGCRFLPRHDHASEVQFIKREIESLTGPEKTTPAAEKGPIARVLTALGKSAT